MTNRTCIEREFVCRKVCPTLLWWMGIRLFQLVSFRIFHFYSRWPIMSKTETVNNLSDRNAQCSLVVLLCRYTDEEDGNDFFCYLQVIAQGGNCEACTEHHGSLVQIYPLHLFFCTIWVVLCMGRCACDSWERKAEIFDIPIDAKHFTTVSTQQADWCQWLKNINKSHNPDKRSPVGMQTLIIGAFRMKPASLNIDWDLRWACGSCHSAWTYLY